MQSVSYKRRRYPPEVISYAVWLYFRFTPSLRDVEELLAQRGIGVSYETIRCWTLKFGPLIAKKPPPAAGAPHRPLAHRRDGDQDRLPEALALARGG